ncbi:hypothetical protein EON65_39740 [archaeon]|nr:MAG: hypothetical protein EON65_39740 [archaeon]
MYQVCGTVRDDRIDYPGRISANAAEQGMIKLLLNVAVSEDAHWMIVDITDFYLGTPLPRKECRRIRLDQIPANTLRKYDVAKLAAESQSVMVEINKGMYGLPQAGKLTLSIGQYRVETSRRRAQEAPRFLGACLAISSIHRSNNGEDIQVHRSSCRFYAPNYRA